MMKWVSVGVLTVKEAAQLRLEAETPTTWRIMALMAEGTISLSPPRQKKPKARGAK